jgi:hypothetical protein
MKKLTIFASLLIALSAHNVMAESNKWFGLGATAASYGYGFGFGGNILLGNYIGTIGPVSFIDEGEFTYTTGGGASSLCGGGILGLLFNRNGDIKPYAGMSAGVIIYGDDIGTEFLAGVGPGGGVSISVCDDCGVDFDAKISSIIGTKLGTYLKINADVKIGF